MERKAIVKRVAATAVLGGTLTLAGVAAASPASAASTGSAAHASVLTNITPAHQILKPADNNCGCSGGICQPTNFGCTPG
jgi:hypothetical protein